MATTISDGTITVTLPDDMFWTDEHSWTPVEQTVSTSITGAAIVDIGTRTAGRPITLVSDEGHAWLPYSAVTQLKTWANTAGKTLTLSLRNANFTVMFRHQEKPAVDVAAVVDYNTPDAQDWFFGTLKFMEM